MLGSKRGHPQSLLTTFHVSPWFQKDEPSSRLNKVPPIGAPKAAATPAAAPADTKSRLSLWKRREGRENVCLLRKGLQTKEPTSYCFTYEPSPSQLGVSWSWTAVIAASEPHRLPPCLSVDVIYPPGAAGRWETLSSRA